MDPMHMAETDPRSSPPIERHSLRRYPERGLLGGVGAGVAEHLGLEVRWVRLAIAMMVVVGGVGVAVYGLAWALIPVAAESRGARRPRGAWREAILIVVCVGAVLFVLRRTGLLLGDRLLWPVVTGICGIALVWRPILVPAPRGPGEARSLRGWLRGRRRIDVPRLTIGGLLVAFASASLLHNAGVLSNLGDAIGAVAIVATALGLLFGPWFVRLARSLAVERAARIREQERAVLAAHLHDSVLQTLALIQKRAEDPREVAGLARRQERELRRWLFERPADGAGDSVKAMLEQAAVEVEDLHGVPIEAIVVGDAPPDARLEALVQAAREAMTNAAKFAGSARVDLYAEIEVQRVEVFVRDRGVGFDLAQVPPDRRGVRDSIFARMQRHGGRALVHSSPGQGTEVELAIEAGA
jgi:signal transduction histidine kinase